MASQSQQQQQESKTIPLKILVDKQSNKVVFVEATKDFVDTLFSFLSLPLGTIVRLLSTKNNNDQQHQQSESSPFLGNIINLYETVKKLNSNDVWNNHFCKQMLLNPRNPCESMCMYLFLNIDDTEPSTKFFVCSYCYMFTNFRNLNCHCGKPPNREPYYLDSEDKGNNAIQKVVRESGQMFLISDDLKIAPSSLLTSMQILTESGIANFTQLEEVSHNIDKQEILNLLKYALTSHEPLTNTLLASSSKIKCNSPNKSASTVRLMPSISDRSKLVIKVLQSKSQKKIIIAEADGDFVDFIFSFLTIPLGSIVKLLGANSFAGSGCVGNLYKSVENLDPTSVLLNPAIAPQFGCPNQPLNISHLQPPPTTYFYSPYWNYPYSIEGVISKSHTSSNHKAVIPLDPREGAVGFMKRGTLYGVGDDLKLKPLSGNSLLSYLKELCFPLPDLEVKVISIGEAEALRFLGAFLTSKFTLTSGLQDFLNEPKQEFLQKCLNKNQHSNETELSISCSFSLCFQHFLEYLAVSVISSFPFCFYYLIGLWFFYLF